MHHMCTMCNMCMYIQMYMFVDQKRIWSQISDKIDTCKTEVRKVRKSREEKRREEKRRAEQSRAELS